jgi:hypothetical protein
MLDPRDQGQGLENGRDLRPGIGLGNTNPVATLGSTFGSGAPSVMRSERSTPSWIVREAVDPHARFVIPGERGQPSFERELAFLWLEPETSNLLQRSKSPKPTASVKLFQQIMNDWDFDDQAAATLLGFEAVSDIRQIYAGVKPVGHRDANDRLRSVLRIATDLHALFNKEVPTIRGWLGEAQSDLGEVSPRSLLTEGSMENLLRVKHYVAYLSGR